MPNAATTPPIRLLHLSDIHFRAGKAWDQDPVLRALARSIAAEVKLGLTPDLVAITGDIAFAGLANEYALAKDWLEQQLWPALPTGFPRDRLLLVPGNHDVDRGKVDFIAEAAQEKLLAQADQHQIANVLGDGGQRDVLLKRHAAYLAFVGDWLGQPQGLPWWQRAVTLHETRLHIAGKLKAQGFELCWVTANNESEWIDCRGWEPVLLDQGDGSKARLKVRDNPAIGGYAILLKKLSKPE